MLSKDDVNYINVMSHFEESMPNYQITGVEQLQDSFQWCSYVNAINQLKYKHKTAGVADSIIEYDLWHGTKETDPEKIIDGEEGFDIKFANQGVWGKGLYFANKARYSDEYCSHHASNTRGMFLAKVLIGKSEKRSGNRSLIGPSAGFDSVSGQQSLNDGSVHDIFIVYANKKAIPQYLVKYTQK